MFTKGNPPWKTRPEMAVKMRPGKTESECSVHKLIQSCIYKNIMAEDVQKCGKRVSNGIDVRDFDYRYMLCYADNYCQFLCLIDCGVSVNCSIA